LDGSEDDILWEDDGEVQWFYHFSKI
jgi:hypothetical protein